MTRSGIPSLWIISTSLCSIQTATLSSLRYAGGSSAYLGYGRARLFSLVRTMVLCGTRARPFLMWASHSPQCATVRGEWSLVVFNLDPTQQAPAALSGRLSREFVIRGTETLGEPTELSHSPCDHQIAIATHDLRLLVIDTNSGVAKRLDSSSHDGGIFDIAWSMDGKWLAYAVSTSTGARTSGIRLCEVESGQVLTLTDGCGTRDTSPAFDPSARFVAFLSSRCLRATEDEVLWQLNFSRAQRPYLAMFTADAPDPLRPPPRPPGWTPEDDEEEDDSDEDYEDESPPPSKGKKGGERERGRGEKGGGSRGGGRYESDEDEEDDEGDDVPEVKVDANGLTDRIIAVPVPPGRLEQLIVLWDDVMLWTRLRPKDEEEEGGKGGGGGGGAGVGGDYETSV